MTGRPVLGPAVDALLAAAWNAGGTDILLTVGLPPTMRISGDLRPVPGLAALTSHDVERLLGELVDLRADDAGRHEQDFSVSWRDLARVRGNAFSQRGQTAVALRIIPRRIFASR